MTKFSDEISSLPTLFSHVAMIVAQLQSQRNTMTSSAADLPETYRLLPDEEIAALFADIDSLTNEARSALLNEVKQRGLSEPQLQKLHSLELRREGRFDRRENLRRKRMVLDRFDLVDLKGWIFALLGALALILISELVSRHH